MQPTNNSSPSPQLDRRASSQSAWVLAVALLLTVGLLAALWATPNEPPLLDGTPRATAPTPDSTRLPTTTEADPSSPSRVHAPDAHRAGCYTAPIGSQFRYDLSATMSYRMTPGSSLTSPGASPPEDGIQLELAPGNRSMETSVRVTAQLQEKTNMNCRNFPKPAPHRE